jgi:ubiquinone/menaquinone biosynthesis C-methylase UbiE
MLSQLLKTIHEPIYQFRLNVLADLITPWLAAGDRVLDIGCGSGRLGEAILASRRCPENLRYVGIEKFPRGGEPIEVLAYDGDRLPLEADSFEVVILADVLHHEPNPRQLLEEARRVSKKRVIIKDHKKENFFDQGRLVILDSLANQPHGVECTYKYNTLNEWHRMLAAAGLTIEREQVAIDLYQRFFNLIFGKSLQYFCVGLK